MSDQQADMKFWLKDAASILRQNGTVTHAEWVEKASCALEVTVETLEWIVEREKTAASAAAYEMGLKALAALSKLDGDHE